jgi:AcrR family transcriptional regulator
MVPGSEEAEMVDLVTDDDRPMRSHARRNRERIIDAARDALTGTGRDASLNEIARRAGVGIGTLFRHFPSREALLEALTSDRTAALCAEATRSLDAPEPAVALANWLRGLIRHMATYRGLPASLLAGTREGSYGLGNSYQAIDAAAAGLLLRAQQTGDVRGDLDVPALISLAGAISWLLEQNPEQAERFDFVMSVLADGLRAAPAR